MGLGLSKQQQILMQARKMKQNLEDRAQKAKRSYQAAFNEIDRQLKRKILTSSARQVADMIDNQQATTLQVVYTFIERTITTGVKNNYVFDEMFQEALAEAFICDQQRIKDQHKKKCWRPGMNQEQCYPPFYGVPTSLKQTLITKGRQIHVGFVAKVNPLTEHDGLFVTMIRKMGFIPIARSNVPQGCKTIETNNNIFGYSKNPWNLGRSCGGSSGGQSGMVASYCAPIGFGSDIGGSCRIPAAFTGLVALKPFNRYSRSGNCYYGKFTGGIPIKSELGPISRTVQDTMLVNNFLCNPQNYKDIPLQNLDPFVKYFPLDMQIINGPQKYKIGVVRRLKHAKCSKANERAVNQAVEILKQKGHEIVEVHLQKIEKLYFFMINIFTFDQSLHLFRQFKGHQPLTIQYRILQFLTKVPWFIRKIVMWFLAKKQPRLVQMLKCSKPMTGTEIFQRIFDIQKVLCPKIYKIFALNKLDAILLPTFVTPAPLHGQAGKLQYFFSFTSAWNVLHYPIGTIPVTVVRPDETDFDDEYQDFYTKNIRKTLKNSQGMPVGVQVGSTPYNEQKILYIMKQLQDEFKFRENHHIPD